MNVIAMGGFFAVARRRPRADEIAAIGQHADFGTVTVLERELGAGGLGDAPHAADAITVG